MKPVWRYGILIGLAILFIWVSSMFGPSKENNTPLQERHDKTILNAVVTPVDNAPEGTYIIEYSNGNKEILHPDGRKVPLVISDQQPKK